MTRKKALITGGCGFIGHHLVEHLMKNEDYDIIILDKLNYSCDGTYRLNELLRLNPEWKDRIELITWDLTSPISHGVRKLAKDINLIIHMAAETHVDNSIVDPMSFVMSNVVGTANILDLAREIMGIPNNSFEKFVLFSTDEVFGPASTTEIPPESVDNAIRQDFWTYREWDRYNATNPYSATKAASEQLVLAYMNTYGIPGFIVRCMNVFGERQHPEKYIPLCIRKILVGETIHIHGNAARTAAGSRFYIHARNVSAAIVFLLAHAEQREVYNIVGEREVDNLTLAQMIHSYIPNKQLNYEIVDFHSSRPGHDLRYSMDGTKMFNIGWRLPKTFEESLQKTVLWYLDNLEFLFTKKG